MAISLPQNFYVEKITLPVTAGAVNIYLSNAPTADSGILVISPRNSSKREIVRYTAKGADGSGDFVTVTLANRGLGGTTDQTHAIDEPVYMNVTAEHFDEIDQAIEQINQSGALDASTTTKGVSKLSVAPVDSQDPIAVGDNDPRIPSADSAAAAAGTVGTPSDTNRFVTQDTIWKEFDQEQALQDGIIQCGQAITTGNRNRVVQSWVPTFPKIRGVNLYKAADTGTFGGDVVVELFADNAGDPDTTILASVTISNADWQLIDVGEFEAVFSTEYQTLTVGDTYWVSVRCSTADSSNHINLGTDSTSSYTDGEMKFENPADGFVSQSADLYFRTLRGITGLIRGQLVQEFTATGTWNKIEGATAVIVEVWGAGGNGGSGASGSSPDGGGSAGGGGAYKKDFFAAKDIEDSVAVTVGSTNGESSQFGDHAIAYGGGAGRTASNSTDWGGGGGGGQLGQGQAGVADSANFPSNAALGGAPSVNPSRSESFGSWFDSFDNTGFGGGAAGHDRHGGSAYYGGGGGGSNGPWNGGNSFYGGGGGGGGGNSSSTTSGNGGGNGSWGGNGGGAAGGSGSTGQDGANGGPFQGGGGGTGGAAGVAGGRGGDGGIAGGGGGGGGYDTDLGGGSNGGGGAGGPGFVRVITIF